MKKLMLALTIFMALGPVSTTLCDRKEKKESKYKGATGVVNRGVDLVLGTGMLIGGSLLLFKSWSALTEAKKTIDENYYTTKGLQWEKIYKLKDSTIDPEERVLLTAIAVPTGALALLGFGLNKVLIATGLKEEN